MDAPGDRHADGRRVVTQQHRRITGSPSTGDGLDGGGRFAAGSHPRRGASGINALQLRDRCANRTDPDRNDEADRGERYGQFCSDSPLIVS